MPPADDPDTWADLIQVRGSSTTSVNLPRGRPVWVRNWRRLTWFMLLVALPTGLAGAYFGLLAADRYIAEAKFIVRKPASISSSALMPVSPEQTLQSGDEDAYAVRDFMLSRDGMQALLDHDGLREAIALGGSDPIWRYPGILNGSTYEQLFRYYGGLVSVAHESTTGVTTLRVEAFDPDSARRLAVGLTNAGEGLLNQLQNRARQDALRVATTEVERTRDLATVAQMVLTDFRTREAVVDPTLLAQTVLATITALSLQVVEAGAQLDLLQHASVSSPQIPPLRSRVTALQAQIDRERATLAGTDLSFAPKIAEYERLLLLRDFAIQNFIGAMTALETARLEGLRQRIYLERVVQPRVADQAAYPYRVLSVMIVFAIGLIAYRISRPAAVVVPSLRAQFR